MVPENRLMAAAAASDYGCTAVIIVVGTRAVVVRQSFGSRVCACYRRVLIFVGARVRFVVIIIIIFLQKYS